MKSIFLVLLGTAAGVFAVTPPIAIDCKKVYDSVKNAVTLDKSKVIEIVSAKMMETPSCACEIVKASIEATKPKPAEVASIVESAGLAAPEQLNVIAECARSAAPDASAAINAMVAKLTSEVASLPNPLDFPGSGPVGPTPGSAGGLPLIPTLPPFVIAPPDVSNVDP